jgi:hypothetical protein
MLFSLTARCLSLSATDQRGKQINKTNLKKRSLNSVEFGGGSNFGAGWICQISRNSADNVAMLCVHTDLILLCYFIHKYIFGALFKLMVDGLYVLFNSLLQMSIVATWVISTIATSKICYCDIVTFILKWMSRMHSSSVLDVLHMDRKIMR